MAVIGIVGSGLMGSGIAQVAAVAGHSVRITDADAAAPGRALAQIAASLEKFVAKEALSDAERDAALARITPADDVETAVGEADLVVEAVVEQVAVKADLFALLDRVAPAHAILASNTSAIPITRIAAATTRPERVVGMHFFSPVALMRLVELVRGLHTSDETLAAARAFAEGFGKECVVVTRDVAGFITTRLISALAVEAIRLVESGVATAEDIDTACRLGFGHSMGPLATADLTGIDVMRNAARAVYDETGEAKFFPPELLNRMVAAGDLGRKSGRGFYEYS